MGRYYCKDISEKKEFSFDGDTLKQKYCYDEEKHIYVYERYNHNGRMIGYELVKGVKYKNPDCSIVYVYTSSEQFGSSGYFISAQWADIDIPKYLLYLKYGRKEGEKIWQQRGQKS